MPFTEELRKKVVDTAIECKEFKAQEDWITLFDTELAEYKNHIPFGNNPAQWANRVIHQLHVWGKHPSGRWILVIFLDILANRQVGLDQEKIKQLGQEVEKALDTLSPEKEFEKFFKQQSPTDDNYSQSKGREWIKSAGNDRDELAFRITLVLLDGCEVTTFRQAYASLTDRLRLPKPEPTPDDKSSSAEPFATPASLPLDESERLAQAGAKRKKVKTDTRKVDVIGLNDTELAYSALFYIWEERVYLHEPLIAWVTELADSLNSYVRFRVAWAVGKLALEHFDELFRMVINPWAGAGGSSFRQVLSNVFWLLLEEGDTDQQNELKDLTWRWASADQRNLRWSASRISLSLAQFFPLEAFQNWGAIINREPALISLEIGSTQVLLPNPVWDSLIDVISMFFSETLETENCQKVLPITIKGFWEWSSNKDPELIGLMSVLFLTVCLITPSDRQDAPTTGDEIPLLLHCFEMSNLEVDYNQHLAVIFYRLLKNVATKELALQILQDWLRAVDTAPAFESTITALIKLIIKEDSTGVRMKDIFQARLYQWSARPRQPISSAGLVLAALAAPEIVIEMKAN